jgi:hypothetical protein
MPAKLCVCLLEVHKRLNMLCRSAVKLAHLDAANCEQPGVVHASVSALVAWRYAQLLDAMPMRETETEMWQSCARTLYSKAGSLQGSIEQSLGGLQWLQGKGEAGHQGFTDVITRRLLPSQT